VLGLGQAALRPNTLGMQSVRHLDDAQMQNVPQKPEAKILENDIIVE